MDVKKGNKFGLLTQKNWVSLRFARKKINASGNDNFGTLDKKNRQDRVKRA
jgi:hypothetical protein